MKAARFHQITRRYRTLRIAVLGDFCLDRYLEIDPGLSERSIETGLPVWNVINVRSQPGGAGTIVNNLAALGIGTIVPIGFCGEDGEGYELSRALRRHPAVDADHFIEHASVKTFTYTKPLVLRPPNAPRELNRLDQKNWSPTPKALRLHCQRALEIEAQRVDAIIVLDQVDRANTGVVTHEIRAALGTLAHKRREIPIVADSRRGLKGFPPLIFKMNAREFAAFSGGPIRSVRSLQNRALALAEKNKRPVFITMAERGLLAASADHNFIHRAALPVRGPIDVVGAGDAVTANITAALAAGASLEETVDFANAGASTVLHQCGTTGTASIADLRKLLVSTPLR